jgi:hypothetical protein
MIAVPEAVRRTRTELTASTGFFSVSETSDTMIGVIAAAKTVPLSQNIGTTNAAIALDAPAISSVVIERPSRFTPLHASDPLSARAFDP